MLRGAEKRKWCRETSAEWRFISTAPQISAPGLRCHIASQLVIFSNVMLKTIARPRSEDDECVSVEKLRSSPLLSLPPFFFLPSPFLLFSRFFQPQQFSGENLWLFVSGFVCTCATSPALGALWFLCWLCPVIAVTRGLSLQRPEEESSLCSFHLQLLKHSFDVLNFRSNLKNGSVQNHLLMQIKPLGSNMDSISFNRAAHPANTLKLSKESVPAVYFPIMRLQHRSSYPIRMH